MGRAIGIMHARLVRLGVGNFEFRAQGASEVSLRLPRSVEDTARLARIAGSTGLLQIFDLEPSLVRGVSSVSDAPKARTLYQLLDMARGAAERDGASSYYLFNSRHKLIAGPALKPGLLPGPGASPAPGDEVLGVPNGTELVSCDLASSSICPDGKGGFAPKPTETWYYLFRTPSQLSNDDLNRGRIRAELTSAGPAITLGFSGGGNAKFHQITRLEWRRGSAQGRPQHFALVVDGRLITFPQINPNDASLSGGVDPSIGGAIIEGFQTLIKANDLAVMFRSGPLPASFHVLSSRTVPAG